jgi:hypothetical protein
VPLVERQDIPVAVPLGEHDERSVGQADVWVGEALEHLPGRRHVGARKRLELPGPARSAARRGRPA